MRKSLVAVLLLSIVITLTVIAHVATSPFTPPDITDVREGVPAMSIVSAGWGSPTAARCLS